MPILWGQSLDDVQGGEGEESTLPPPAPTGPKPTAGQTLAAATLSSPIATLYDRFLHPRPDAPAVPGFDPLVSVQKGYETQADRFLDARSPDDMAWIKDRLDYERQAADVNRRSGSWGSVANFAVGAIDPITLASMAIPVGGATRLASAAKTAGLFTGVSLTDEALSRAATPGGGEDVSWLNIGAQTFLGGLLGAAFHVPPKKSLKMAEDLTEEWRQGKTSTDVLGPENNGVITPATQAHALAQQETLNLAQSHQAIEPEIPQTRPVFARVVEGETPEQYGARLKAFAKQYVDTGPPVTPADLNSDSDLYFNRPPGTIDIPTAALKTTKTGEDKGASNSLKRMKAAEEGVLPKRDPISVRQNEDGSYTVLDGNGTTNALKQSSMVSVPVQVVEKAEGVHYTDEQLERLEPAEREQLKQRFATTREDKPAYDHTLTSISNRIPGSTAHIAPMKGARRAIDKIVGDYKDEPNRVGQVKDLLRGTIAVDNPEDIDTALEQVKKHMDVTKIKDRRGQSADGYKDILLNVRRPDGSLAEVQIMTKHTRHVKEVNAHDLYVERETLQRKIRDEQGGDETPEQTAKIAELNGKMRALYESPPAASHSFAVKRTPLRDTESSEYGRGPLEPQIRVEAPPPSSGDLVTGMSSTSKNSVPLGKVDDLGRLPNMEGYPPSEIIPKNVHPVYTATGRRLEVESRIVEADDVVTSDRAGYPQELQPRQRGNRAALSSQVSDMAANLNPDLLGESATASDGAPITGPGHIVESGNGRVMAIRKAYANHPERAAAYRAQLEAMGHDTSGFKQPVLVRERLTPLTQDERRAYTVEANKAAQASMSPTELANADARLLDGPLLAELQSGNIGARNNASFVGKFLSRLAPGERAGLMAADGAVSAEGVRRIQGALLAKAYGGHAESQAILTRLLESTDSDVRSIMRAMLDVSPQFARLREAIAAHIVPPEFDVSAKLVRAVEDTAKLRSEGRSLKEFLDQGDMLTARDPEADALIRSFYNRNGRAAGRERIAAFLREYVDRAEKLNKNQGGLFGDAAVAPHEILEHTLEGRPEDPIAEPTGELFNNKPAAAESVAVNRDALPPADSGGLPETPKESEPLIANPSGESTVGSAATMSGAAIRNAALEAEGVARGAKTLAKTLGRVAPGLRLLTSPSIVARRLVQAMANTGEVLEKNRDWVPTEQPVERRLWKLEGTWQVARDGRSQQFKGYRERMAGLGETPISRRDFDAEIAAAMRRSDRSAIPEVEAAARHTRATIFQPLYDRAVKLGLVPEDAKLYAESYLMRQYDVGRITENLGDWLKRLSDYFETQGAERAEARDIAHSVTRNITSSERDTMDWKAFDNVVPEASPLKGRTLSVPDSVLEPYLNSDMDSLTHSYLRSMGPEVEMTERFGSRDMKDQLKELSDEYARLKEIRLARGDDAGAKALDDRHNADYRDLVAIRDRLYGIYGRPKDPSTFFIRAGRMLRAGNVLRLLGAATLAHFPDVANAVVRYGLTDTMAGVAKLATSLEAMKLSRADAHRMGAALDMAMSTASILGDYGSHSQFLEQRIANKLTRGFTVATGETPFITVVQMLASTVGQHSLLETAERFAKSGKIGQNDVVRLAQGGIDQDMLRRIAKQASTYGREVNGLRFGMSDQWADQAAAQAFESAILKDAHGMTLRPSVADTPLVMSSEVGKAVMQFKTFAYAAQRAVVNPMLQGVARGDPRAMVGLMTLLGAGFMSYVSKQIAAGQPIEWDNTGRMALEVLDKSNLMSWTADAVFPALWQFGFKDLSRWSDRDPVETLLGPSAGTLTSAFERQLPAKLITTPIKNASGTAEGNEPTFKRNDAHFIRRMSPGQNVWWFRRAVNSLEDAVGDYFQLEGKSNADRAAERAASNP